MPTSKVDLSVIVLNYNAGDFLTKCLESLASSQLDNYRVEVVVADADSSDQSMQMAEAKKDLFKDNIELKLIYLKTNRGFSAGNNSGLRFAKKDSRYVLFLNPDTTVEKNTLKTMLDFFERKPDAAAATCKIILVKTGKIQMECHRGFPTPSRGFWHFFGMGLPKLFPKSKLLNGYFLGHLDLNKIHQIEACSGAFLMVRREVGELLNWWNEKYFMYGEDLDFGYKLWLKGLKLYFVPTTKIYHYQGISSGIKNHSEKQTKASKETKMRSAIASIEAMRIFYEENLAANYPKVFNIFVLSGIKLLEVIRKTRVRLRR